jgi:hypothetical protein
MTTKSPKLTTRSDYEAEILRNLVADPRPRTALEIADTLVSGLNIAERSRYIRALNKLTNEGAILCDEKTVDIHDSVRYWPNPAQQ